MSSETIKLHPVERVMKSRVVQAVWLTIVGLFIFAILASALFGIDVNGDGAGPGCRPGRGEVTAEDCGYSPLDY